MIHSLRVIREFHVDLSHFLSIDICQEVCLVIAFRGRRGGGRDASDFFACVALALVLFLLLRLLIFMLIVTLQ